MQIATLICHRDVERALTCLDSARWAFNNDVSFVFFSDGTLSAEDETLLCAHFSNSRVVSRQELEQSVSEELEKLPHCRKIIPSSIYSLKLIHMPLFFQRVLNQKHYRYLDTDILFFERVENWRALWEKNAFLCEREVILSGRPFVILKHHPVLRDVNAGLISFDMRHHDLEFIESFLGNEELIKTNYGVLEQTCWNLLGARAHSQGEAVWQIAPDQIVSSHYFETMQPRQVGLHFIGKLKPRVHEFGDLALSAQNWQQKSPLKLGFQRANPLTWTHAATLGVLNRTKIRGKILKCR